MELNENFTTYIQQRDLTMEQLENIKVSMRRMSVSSVEVGSFYNLSLCAWGTAEFIYRDPLLVVLIFRYDCVAVVLWLFHSYNVGICLGTQILPYLSVYVLLCLCVGGFSLLVCLSVCTSLCLPVRQLVCLYLFTFLCVCLCLIWFLLGNQ